MRMRNLFEDAAAGFETDTAGSKDSATTVSAHETSQQQEKL